MSRTDTHRTTLAQSYSAVCDAHPAHTLPPWNCNHLSCARLARTARGRSPGCKPVMPFDKPHVPHCISDIETCSSFIPPSRLHSSRREHIASPVRVFTLSRQLCAKAKGSEWCLSHVSYQSRCHIHVYIEAHVRLSRRLPHASTCHLCNVWSQVCLRMPRLHCFSQNAGSMRW